MWLCNEKDSSVDNWPWKRIQWLRILQLINYLDNYVQTHAVTEISYTRFGPSRPRQRIFWVLILRFWLLRPRFIETGKYCLFQDQHCPRWWDLYFIQSLVDFFVLSCCSLTGGQTFLTHFSPRQWFLPTPAPTPFPSLSKYSYSANSDHSGLVKCWDTHSMVRSWC